MDDSIKISFENNQERNSVLCLYYFSHPFHLGSYIPNSRSLSTENKKALLHHVPCDSSFLPRNSKCRRSFVNNGNVCAGRKKRYSKKRNVLTLVKYLAEAIQLDTRRSQLPRLEDVVDTLKAAWPRNIDFSKCYSKNEEDLMAQSTQNKSSGLPSPVLMRRRLSAPETVMRKHTLSQQRSDSTESVTSQYSSISSFSHSYSNSLWNRGSSTGSESNLFSRKSLKRDPDLMRKSTLLRRMWSREFTGNNTQSFNEEVFPRKSSLPSKASPTSPSRLVRKSPEHTNRQAANVNSSPEKTYVNRDITNVKHKWSSVPETNSYTSYTSDTISAGSSTSESNKFILETSSTDIKLISTCPTSNETYTNTNTTANSESNMDEYSDSAYTNTQTFTTYSSSKTSSVDNNNGVNFCVNSIKQMPNANDAKIEQSDNYLQNTQATLDLNSNQSSIPDNTCNNHNETRINLPLSDIDQQTSEINVMNLTTATWNIIINHPSDPITIQKQTEETESIGNEANSIQTTEIISKPDSFYLKSIEDQPIDTYHSRLISCMISNVGAGSTYVKPMNAPQLVVPRYSALPRTLSMEVNTSSTDSTDKESDTASLVDSLDDPNSPRQSATTPRIKHDDKPVRGDLSVLLPDNSSSCNEKPKTKSQKSSAFYIPIVRNETNENVKAVAELLPDKVRNKLRKRQQKMIRKKLHTKSKTDDQYLDSNSNQSDNATYDLILQNNNESKTSSNSSTFKKPKKENNVLLLPSYKINSRGELTLNPNATANLKRAIIQNKKKHVGHSESTESSSYSGTIRQPIVKSHQKSPAPSPVRSPEKSSVNIKHDVAQVTEWDSVSKKQLQTQLFKSSSKSKIPILIQNKVPEFPKQIQMQGLYHTYDFSEVSKYNSKADQLIANILIDALNKSDMVEIDPQESTITLIHSPNLSGDKKPIGVSRQHSSRYQHKFEMIPEEKLSSLGSSVEECGIVADDSQTIGNEGNIVKVKKAPNTEMKLIEVQTQVETQEQNIPEDEVQTTKKSLTDASSQTESTVVAATSDLSHAIPNPYKGKAALALMKDEDFSTIPKGWITFYMLRKNPGSPDSSIDEGTNPECLANKGTVLNVEEKPENLELRQLRPVLIKRKCTNKENLIEEPILENVINTQENTNVVWRESEIKKVHSLENNNESLVISQKEHYSSSSETFNGKSPASFQETNLSLPIALPVRQGKRQSYRRGRYKTSSQNQGPSASQMPGVWSVTVSGTNSCGQLAPDLEMRLKFPCPQPTSQSDSGLGEEQPRQPRRHFPHQQSDGGFHLPPAKPASTKKYTVVTKKQTDDQANESINNRSFQYLPDLIKNRNIRTAKRRDVSVPVRRTHQLESLVNSMPPLKTRMPAAGGQQPRQTLTSYRRFSLRHSSHLSPHIRTLLPSALSAATINNREIIDLPECFPTILAVTGSAISPENKPKVPTLNKKELARNHFSFRQHHA